MATSTYCANKYAIIDANTAIGDNAKTWVKVASFMGEEGIAGATSAIKMIPMEKKEANIPAVTIWFAIFLP